MYWRWRSSTRGEGWNTFATYLCLSQVRNWISNVIYHCRFCVQWVRMRGNCSFCWYWWNGPSLSFDSRNIFFVMHILYSTSSNIIPIIHKIYLNMLIITSLLLNIYILLSYIYLPTPSHMPLTHFSTLHLHCLILPWITYNMFSNQYFYNIFTL